MGDGGLTIANALLMRWCRTILLVYMQLIFLFYFVVAGCDKIKGGRCALMNGRYAGCIVSTVEAVNDDGLAIGSLPGVQ